MHISFYRTIGINFLKYNIIQYNVVPNNKSEVYMIRVCLFLLQFTRANVSHLLLDQEQSMQVSHPTIQKFIW